MKNKLPNPVLPPITMDVDDTRVDLERLESEAQTHDEHRDAGETEKAIISSDHCIRRIIMKTTAGLWIDHRRAVIAIVSDDGEETLEIKSNVEKQPGRLAGKRSTTSYESQKVPADDSRERQFTGQLRRYYDVVIAAIREAEAILIFGPGEAKGELKKRLTRDNLGGRIVAMGTADKMTDRQIAAKVSKYFHS